MAQLDIETIEQLPIKMVSKEEPAPIATLVDKLLGLNKQLSACVFTDQKAVIKSEIDKIDAEIDERVFDLYGITEQEKQIVDSLGVGKRELEA